MIEVSEKGLKVTWDDGRNFTFHPLWLRERSFSESNKDPTTGHRIQEVAFLPLDLGLSKVKLRHGRLFIDFSDKHSCIYDLEDLRSCIERPMPEDMVGEKILWDARLTDLVRFEFEQLKSSDRYLLALLNSIATRGFALVRNVGTDNDSLADLASLFGPMRETNWGRIADVKSIANAYDLSMTGRALEPHVDNPYRLPEPGYIFLHCLRNDAQGGESTIVDGFNAAQRLRALDEESFNVLATTVVTFRYADSDTILEHYGYMIERRPDGRLAHVRFHNRADQVVPLQPDELDAFYRARQKFAQLIWSDELTVRFKLNPGEAYIVDNYRLFHGRTSIDLSTGGRHLRQCYMDRDILSSRQKVLINKLHG